MIVVEEWSQPVSKTDQADVWRLASAKALVVAEFERGLEPLVDDATEGVLEIAGYRQLGDPSLREDVREHITAHIKVCLDIYARGRAATREDVAPMRARAARRVTQGISVADFMHAFEATERTLVRRALELTTDERLRIEMPALVSSNSQYCYMATVEAAEAYLEAESLRSASHEGIRRDLVEDLIAGQAPSPGPPVDAARDAGLDPGSACLVIAVAPTAPADSYALRGAAAALSRAPGGAMLPLAVVRRRDIVIVLPAPGDGGTALVSRLADVQGRLADRGLPLAVGVSSIHEGFPGVQSAYREAAAARERLLPSPGILALCTMSTFDYLTWSGDDTSRHLIRPSVERFVTESCGTAVT
jgi:hypothetical protein